MEQTEVKPNAGPGALANAPDRETINWRCQDGYQWLDEFTRAFELAFRHNPFLAKACEGVMEQMAEARRRLSDRCPVLIGQDMGYVETCMCWRCTFCDEGDPFADNGNDDT